MNLNELGSRLGSIEAEQADHDLPGFDPGEAMEVIVESSMGTFESEIIEVAEAPKQDGTSDVTLVVREPDYTPDDAVTMVQDTSDDAHTYRSEDGAIVLTMNEMEWMNRGRPTQFMVALIGVVEEDSDYA